MEENPQETPEVVQQDEATVQHHDEDLDQGEGAEELLGLFGPESPEGEQLEDLLTSEMKNL